MRGLQKVVFVKSAHIRYAEFKVDGNVHLSGTQGVGKSTVLRALLYFYTADSKKLGLDTSKKSFAEYYLPDDESHIVYEVDNDVNRYCVFLYRTSGAIKYWVINAPYDKSWLMNEQGEVVSGRSKVVARLPQGVTTKVLQTRQAFQSLIWGEGEIAKSDMVAFSLCQGKGGFNLSKAIQNVFSNSRLENAFLKGIIASSASEKCLSINLRTLRKDLDRIALDKECISAWLREKPKGVYPVQNRAGEAVDAYKELLGVRDRFSWAQGELPCALAHNEQRQPVVEQLIVNKNEAINERIKALRETNTQKDNEKALKNQTIGVLNHNLKTCEKLHKTYPETTVQQWVTRSGQRPSLEKELDSTRQMLETLTDTQRSVMERYDKLYRELDQNLKDFEQNMRDNRQDARTAYMDQRKQAGEEKEEAFKAIEALFRPVLERLNEDRDKANKEVNRLNTEIQLAEKERFFEQELTELANRLRDLQEKERFLKKDIDALLNREAVIERDAKAKRQEATLQMNHFKETKERELADCEKEIDHIQKLLENLESSLYQWLQANTPNWEETIGKVIDEEHVLYANGLNPQKVVSGDPESFYGVKLDLESIERSMRRPERLREDLRRLQAEQASLTEKLRANQQKYEADIKAIQDEADAASKKVRTQRERFEGELKSLPQLIGKAKASYALLQDKAEAERKQKVDRLTAEKREAEASLLSVGQALKEQQARQASRKREEEEKYKQALVQAEALLEAEKRRLDGLLEERKKRIAQEKQTLQMEKEKELKEGGADVTAIKRCEQHIKEIEGELRAVKAIEEKLMAYRLKKEEYLDHESEWRLALEREISELAQLEQKYATLLAELQRAKQALEVEKSDLEQELSVLKKDWEDANEFLQGEGGYQAFLPKEVVTHETTRSVGEIIKELKELYLQTIQIKDKMKKCVNQFLDAFQPGNLFNFTLKDNTDESYEDFADYLSLFISNHMAEELISVQNEHYRTALNTVFSSYVDIERSLAEVKALVNRLNDDFEQHNFTGVIKNIKLRIEDSDDVLVKRMSQIRKCLDDYPNVLQDFRLVQVDEEARQANKRVIELLMDLVKALQDRPDKEALSLEEAFVLNLRIKENDNDSDWITDINTFGSEGTDILVKAIINIMLISVFKKEAAKKSQDFMVHCMMDEIGKLHPSNINGLIAFANQRGIRLINGSPVGINFEYYNHVYKLSKDKQSNTIVKRVGSRIERA